MLWLDMHDKSYNLDFITHLERTKTGLRLHFVDGGIVDYDLADGLADSIYADAPPDKRKDKRTKSGD